MTFSILSINIFGVRIILGRHTATRFSRSFFKNWKRSKKEASKILKEMGPSGQKSTMTFHAVFGTWSFCTACWQVWVSLCLIGGGDLGRFFWRSLTIWGARHLGFETSDFKSNTDHLQWWMKRTTPFPPVRQLIVRISALQVQLHFGLLVVELHFLHHTSQVVHSYHLSHSLPGHA